MPPEQIDRLRGQFVVLEQRERLAMPAEYQAAGGIFVEPMRQCRIARQAEVTLGHAIALHAALSNGIEIFMLDTIALYGHMLELYAPSPALLGIYDFIRNAAVDFDGRDPVRPFSFD